MTPVLLLGLLGSVLALLSLRAAGRRQWGVFLLALLAQVCAWTVPVLAARERGDRSVDFELVRELLTTPSVGVSWLLPFALSLFALAVVASRWAGHRRGPRSADAVAVLRMHMMTARSGSADSPSVAHDVVYVNQDGSARELAPDEIAYLATEFEPGDGGRPYVKRTYETVDGWGSLSGFLPRRRLPEHVVVQPVRPDYVPEAVDSRAVLVRVHERAGDRLQENRDGSVQFVPDPAVPSHVRFERLRAAMLEEQRDREARARMPSSPQ